MPQKTRKEKERAAQRRASGQMRAPIAPPPVELTAPETERGFRTTAPAAALRRSPSAAAVVLPHSADAEFNYSYVFADLRRIGVLALLCFGIMLALTFFLR